MKRLILALSIFIAIQASGESKSCAAYLSLDDKISSVSDTDQYLAFIAALLKENALPYHFLLSLAEGKVTNPFENELGNSDHIIYAPMMQDYMKANLDIKKIKIWAQQELNRQKKTTEEKTENKKNTKTATIKMTFHRIEGGDFLLDGKHPYKIDSYELMSTSVTQSMWAKLQSLAGSRDASVIWPSENIGLNEKSIPSNLDHPVENITFFEAEEFIKKLNTLSRSHDPKIQASLREIIFDHQVGDTYDFPTFLQMQFARNNRGLNSHEWFQKQDIAHLTEMDWFDENSKHQTHPVAEKKPFAIGGKYFFDLNGNVFNWTKNTYLEVSDLLKMEIIKDYDKTSLTYTLQGGSLFTNAKHFGHATVLYNLKPEDKMASTGLRLVRHREAKK